MIEAGIPAKACLHAMTLHWDDQSRVMAGIETYDPASEFPGGVRAYLDTLVKARVHVYLYGEAGFGKSYWAEQLADRLGVDFGQIPCNEGVSPSWFVGKDTVTGYKASQLVELLPKPSVYLFDEIDRMDSNMAVLVNGMLANGTLANPVTGEDVVQHEDCILVFAGNSLGEGSNKYHSANELDPSTKDRVRMGRVEIGYDREIEDMIAFG
jgi:MoxR-like ATPase